MFPENPKEPFNGLGPGFLEKIYEEATVLVLRKSKHTVEVQKPVPVMFLGKQIGTHVLDIVVDGRIILELKAVSEIAQIHKQQALSYLKATGLPLALVINFGDIVYKLYALSTRNKRRILSRNSSLSRFSC